MNRFPERLKEALKAKGMIQQELADKLNTNQSTISLWIAGKREPDYAMLMRICYYLDEEPGYMLGYDVDELAKEEQDEAKLKERQEKQRKEDLLRKKGKAFTEKLFRAFGGEVNYRKLFFTGRPSGHDWGKVYKLIDEFIGELAGEGYFSEEELKQFRGELESQLIR